MSETDLQIGGGYVYQWECALLLALNHFFEPVRYDPTLFDLVEDFLGEVAEMQLEGEDRQNGVELEDINLIKGDRRILIQVKTKQAEGEPWTLADPLLLKALYRFYASRFSAEEPDNTRFVFLTNRPLNRDLVRVKSAIKRGAVDECAEAGKLYEQLARYAKTEKKAGVDRDRFDAVMGRTALVEYLSVDTVKANVQAKLQAYGRADWREAHTLLLEYFMRQSTRVGGGVVTRESVTEVLGPRRLPTVTVSPLHQLPADLADFTGREGEVRELAALLGEGAGGATISAIGGMGGVGKTALAVHVAHKVAARYPDGQIVVEMGGTSERPLTPVEAMGRVIHAFQPELRLPDEPNEVTALYRTTLEGRKALLLLDNAANSAQVRPLVVPAGCGLVVTSRHNISLPGLRHFDLDALPEKKARKLLRAIVGRRRATGEELGAIVELCGRLPLALRVAGDFLVVHPDWSAAEYARPLADERERLARLKHEDLDVGAALGLSAAQLVRERADLAARWQMLAVFPAPFERSAVAAVWGVEEEEARDGLSELAARSLVLYEREGGLYRLHDLMRLVAEDAFGYGGGERDAEEERARLGEAAMRHAAYYLEVGSRANALYKQGGEHVLEGLRLFDGAWPHLWAAYGRMRERGDRAAVQWTSEFPGEVTYVLDLRLPPRDKIPILEAAAAAARKVGERSHEGVHLGNLGLAYHSLGETRRAIEYHEQALEIARAIGDRRNEGAWLGNLGNAYRDLGEVRRAIEYYEQALSVAREIGDREGEGNRLGNLGNAYADLGEVRRAIEYYEQALIIAREIGDRRGEGAALGNLGLAYADLGEARRAIEYYEQALAIAREIGDRHNEGAWLANLGNAYAALGEVRRAIEYYEQALAISREIGDRRGEGNDLGNLGLAYANLGEVRRAIEYYEQALAIAREIGDRRMEGNALGNLGNAYADLGEVRRAIEYYEQALAISREIGDRRGEGVHLGNLGIAYKNLGEARRAFEYYEQALTLAREIGDRRGEGNRLGNLGIAYKNLGEVQRAIEYYEQALAIAREIGDRHNEGAWLANLGNAYAALGKVRQAIEHYEQALEIAREIGDKRIEGNQLGNLGVVYKDLGDLARARQLGEQALKIYEAIEDPNAERVRGWLKQLNEG